MINSSMITGCSFYQWEYIRDVLHTQNKDRVTFNTKQIFKRRITKTKYGHDEVWTSIITNGGSVRMTQIL